MLSMHRISSSGGNFYDGLYFSGRTDNVFAMNKTAKVQSNCESAKLLICGSLQLGICYLS